MLYDFRCEDCGELFEVQRPIAKRDDPAQCPVCGSGNAHRVLMQVPAIKLQWYGPALSEATVPRMLRPVRKKVGGANE